MFSLTHTEHIDDTLVDGFINYLANAREIDELIPLLNKIQIEIPFYGDKIMTYAEHYKQEGRQGGVHISKQ